MPQFTNPLKHFSRSFRKNDDGVAAIEFAFIAPILLTLYFGMTEIASVISVDRRISHSANVAGDLSTQVASINANEMEEILNATLLVMGIGTANYGDAKMDITSYLRNADDSIQTIGSAKLNGGVSTTFDPTAIDNKILTDQSGVVVARVQFAYTPPQLQFMSGNINIEETFLLKPRKSNTVTIENAAGNANFTCTATSGAPVCSDA